MSELNAAPLQEQFQQAVATDGEDYIKAREAVLAVGAEAVPPLEEKAQDGDWRVSMTAEILVGWLQRAALYEQCADEVQAKWVEASPVKPITGEMSASKRANVIAAHGEPVVPRLLEMLVKTHEYRSQVELDAILLALSYLADQRATMPLLDVVEHTDEAHLRSMSVSVLGSLKDSRAVDPLVAILADAENDRQLRSAAGVALGAIGDGQAREPLERILLDEDSHVQLRQQVAYALGLLGDTQAAPALIKVLEGAQDRDLVRLAVEALGKVGDQSALPAVQRVEQQHPTGIIHRVARKARAAIEARLQAGGQGQ